MWDAKRSSSRLLSINILKSIDNIDALKEILCNSDVVLVCLKAISSLEVRRYHDLDNIRQPGGEKGNITVSLKCSAKVYYGLHYLKKWKTMTHIAGHLIRKVTPLELSCVSTLASFMSCGAPHQQRSLNLSNHSSFLKIGQRLKPIPPI